MFTLFSTPTWIQGWDLAFDIIVLVVMLLIAAYSYRIYQIHEENKFGYFAFAFILLALGLFAKLVTSSILYFTPVRDTAAIVLGPMVGERLSLSHLYYRAGYFLQMAPMLAGWLLIFFLSQKSRERLRKVHELSQIVLFIYLILLISVVSNFQVAVFFVTSVVLLALIVLNYYKNYLDKGKKKSAYRVMLSFLFVLVGNIFLAFVFVIPIFYALGELFMLVGFLLLLHTYYTITRK